MERRQQGKTSFGHDPKSDEDSGKIFIDFIVLEVRSLEFQKYRKGEQNQRFEKEEFSVIHLITMSNYSLLQEEVF